MSLATFPWARSVTNAEFVAPFHRFTVSPSHRLTVPPCHRATVPPCHRATVPTTAEPITLRLSPTGIRTSICFVNGCGDSQHDLLTRFEVALAPFSRGFGNPTSDAKARLQDTRMSHSERERTERPQFCGLGPTNFANFGGTHVEFRGRVADIGWLF